MYQFIFIPVFLGGSLACFLVVFVKLGVPLTLFTSKFCTTSKQDLTLEK
jgi:hypothetical protein